MNFKRSLTGFAAATGLSLALMASGQAAQPTVIELTQTACQFIESENGVDHGYKTAKKADCAAINDDTGDERLASAKTLELKPGKYVFRVSNRDVPYALGFWLRGEGLVGRATLPSVSGGGLTEGATKDYVIELKEGEYLYSCPLNPTPDYKIVVKS
ncbi:MAG: hypothetical protein AAF495_11860 [Pseudomonadota bacterium]